MILFTFTMTWASSEKRYLSSLQYASQKVLLKKQKSSSPLALSTSMISRQLGRPYQVGESWLVLAFIDEREMMRRTAPTRERSGSLSQGGLFEYRVTEIKTGFQPEITLSIHQVNHSQFPTLDPQVNQLFLILDNQLSQKKKFYAMTHQSSFISVPWGGIGVSLSPLNFYPLDLPEMITAQESTQPKEPTMLQEVQLRAKPFLWKVNLNESDGYEQEDFFGRPIDILWEKGKPWPSYIKTPRGISILIESGGNHES